MVLLSGDTDCVKLPRSREQMLDFARLITVVVRKRAGFDDFGAKLPQCGVEFFRSTDTGEGQDTPTPEMIEIAIGNEVCR